MQNFLNADGVMLLARVVAFATSIPLHEAAHAFVSDKQGDPTPRQTGRLTLNPLKHIDPWGLLAMLTIGFGWAKPVQINPNYYKNPKRGMAITAAAGPISNLLLAYVCMVIYKVGSYSFYGVAGFSATMPAALSVLLTVFSYLVIINVGLAVFNLMPVPPFDGSRIFSVFLPDKWYFGIQKYERIIMVIMLVLLYFGAFSGALGTLNTWVLKGFDWATGYIDVAFLAFLRA